MADRFSITLALGNDAMQTPSDVAEALRALANQLSAADTWTDAERTTTRIADRNGNRAGAWQVD